MTLRSKYMPQPAPPGLAFTPSSHATVSSWPHQKCVTGPKLMWELQTAWKARGVHLRIIRAPRASGQAMTVVEQPAHGIKVGEL